IEGRVANLVGGNAWRHLRGLATGVSLLFREGRPAVGHDDAAVADPSLIDPRIVDLVEDTVAQAEPDMAVASNRGPDAALRARCPTPRYARPAGGQWFRFVSHP